MSQPTLEDELDAERAHLADSRAALHRMRVHAEALYATGANVSGDPFGAESLGRALARRVAELADDPSTPLFFGRLDFQPGGLAVASAAGAPADDIPTPPELVDDSAPHHHVGRRHVTDDARRADGARLAGTHLADLLPGQRRRTRRAWRSDAGSASTAGELTSFEDEHLDRGEELGTASRILTAEIERPRVGPMRDIVATIQPEQDELVRADLDETICVQGAPGTGKTAVGLHRAAYLLYLHRERLRRSGVLVVGPNRAFLSYISSVLPALGEVEVEQASVDDLVAVVAVRGIDSPETARLKHDDRWAAVLRRALAALIRRPTSGLTVPDGSWRWRISAEALRRIVDEVRREDPPYGVGRERVRARTVAMLQRQAEARRGDSPPETWLRRMGRDVAVRAFLDQVWPEMTGEQLVFSLLSDPDALAAAADGDSGGDGFNAREREMLLWHRPPRTVKAARWSAADTVLIDEAAGLIDRLPSFGHIVVDEAQDLSPMQCRVIARRSEHGSITLLGDLAQGTAPWAARDWNDTLAHLGKAGARVVALTTGFRVPEVVVDLANRLLPALDVDVPEAVSLRRDGFLDIQSVVDIPSSTVVEVRAALAFEGSVAVIAADAAGADAGNDLARHRHRREYTGRGDGRRVGRAGHRAASDIGQGPRVRPRHRGGTGPDRGGRAPRPAPPLRRTDPSRVPPHRATRPTPPHPPHRAGYTVFTAAAKAQRGRLAGTARVTECATHVAVRCLRREAAIQARCVRRGGAMAQTSVIVDRSRRTNGCGAVILGTLFGGFGVTFMVSLIVSRIASPDPISLLFGFACGGPFALLGGAIVASGIRNVWLSHLFGVPTLTIPRGAQLRLGGALVARFHRQGGTPRALRTPVLCADLVCRMTVTIYGTGPDKHTTVTEEACRHRLTVTTDQVPNSVSGQVFIEVPLGMPPSTAPGHNQVIWSVEVRVRAPGVPEDKSSFTMTVLPVVAPEALR